MGRERILFIIPKYQYHLEWTNYVENVMDRYVRICDENHINLSLLDFKEIYQDIKNDPDLTFKDICHKNYIVYDPLVENNEIPDCGWRGYESIDKNKIFNIDKILNDENIKQVNTKLFISTSLIDDQGNFHEFENRSKVIEYLKEFKDDYLVNITCLI